MQNPGAGAGASAQRQFEKALRRAGHEVTTVEPDSGLGKNLSQRTDVVIAAGGDGTVLSVARRLVETTVPLVILPLGTANNLARSVGAAPDVEGLLRVLEAPVERDLDIGIASGNWGEQYFCESAGVGAFSDLLKEGVGDEDKAPHRAVRVLGDFLRRATPKQYELTIDGKDASGEYLMVEVMNAKLLGPNLVLCATAVPYDQRLEVVLVRQKDRQTLLSYLVTLEQQPNAPPPVFPTRTARHVALNLRGHTLRVDDALRPKPGSPDSHFADLRLLKGAVRLWLPTLEHRTPVPRPRQARSKRRSG